MGFQKGNTLNRIFAFSSISFPGAFRVFVVFFVSFFCVAEQSDKFSNLFLYVAFFSSISGIPLASVSMERRTDILFRHAILVVLVLCIIFSLFLFFLEPIFGLSEILAIFVCVFLSSIYELIRQKFLNNAEFKILFYYSFISLVFFSGLALLFLNNAILLLFIYFISLLAPALFFLKKNSENDKVGCYFFNFSVFLKKYTSYMLSSTLSTSINFLLPLIIVFYLGKSFSLEITQVFSIVSVFLLAPRVSANSYVILLRGKGFYWECFYKFIVLVTAYVFSVSIILFFVFAFYFEVNSLYYFLLGLSVLLSLLTLPYSCVFSVYGHSNVTLKVNLISIILAVFFFYTFNIFTLEKNELYVFLTSVVGYQLLKLFISHYYFNKMSFQND